MISKEQLDKAEAAQATPTPPRVPMVADMTLRDYFAACALVGLTGLADSKSRMSEMAEDVFCMADWMMDERKKGTPT